MMGNVMLLEYLIVFCLVTISHCLEPLITITRSDPQYRNGVIYAIQGQDVTLTCYAENVDPAELQVIWERDYEVGDGITQPQDISSNTDIMDNTKFSIDKPTQYSWRLRIKNIQVADTAEYTCYVRMTSISTKRDSMTVLVQMAPMLDPAKTSSSMVRKVGDNVQLSCDGIGLPTPSVKWTRLGGAPLPSPINREVFEEPKMTLSNIQARDRGTYRCLLINSVKSVRRDIKLDIQFAPIISVPHPVVEQAVGYLIELQCQAESNPFPGNLQVSWRIGSKTIDQTGKRYVIKYLQGAFNRLTYELIIRSVSEKDFGTYQCIIKNTLGTSSGQVKLIKSNTPVQSYKLGRIVKGGAVQLLQSVTLVLLCLSTFILLL